MPNRIPVPALDMLDTLSKLIVVNDKELKEAITTFVTNFREELHGLGYESSEPIEFEVQALKEMLNDYFRQDDDTVVSTEKQESESEDEDESSEDDYFQSPKPNDDDEDDDLEGYINGA